MRKPGPARPDPKDTAPPDGPAGEGLRTFASLRVAISILFGFGLIVLTAVLFEPRDRTFLVEVETGGLTLRPDGTERAVWKLPQGTILCYRLPAGAAKDDSPQSKLCPGDAYRAERVATVLEFLWPEGVELDLRSDGAGGMVIAVAALPPSGENASAVAEVKVSTALPGLPVRSLVLVPRRVLGSAGAVPFSGAVVIGMIPDGGATGLVVSGRYSTRQVPLFRSDPVEVQSGTLTRGDLVRIAQSGEEAPVKVYGFLSASVSGAAARTAFSVVAVSQPARAELVVERYSGDPSRIAPSWVDRALQDPLILGVSAVLAIFSFVYGVLKDLWSAPATGSTTPSRKGR